MTNIKLCKYSLIHSLAVIIYIFLVACLMKNAEQLFGQAEGIIGVVAFLLLFVLSAAVMGALVLGKPVMMFLAGDRKEAVKLFLYTILWLLGWLILIFIIIALI